MRPILVDASVARRWFFRDRDDEPDAEAALAVLRGVRDGDFALLQPPHFVAEVAAVLVREMPDTALHRLRDLLDIEMTVVGDPVVHARAVTLAGRTGTTCWTRCTTPWPSRLRRCRSLPTSATLARRDLKHVARLGEFHAPAG